MVFEVPVGKLLTGLPSEALSHCGEFIERRRLTDMLPSTQDAVSAAKAGDLSTACALLDQCIQEEADPAALFQAALCYRSADRVNDALSLLKTLEDRGQTQPPALLLRADIFCSLDRHQHALPLYKTLAEIEHAPMQYSAALGLFNCGDISACLAVIKLLTDNPDPTLAAQAKLLEGRALAANEAFDLAVDSLNQVASPPAPQALQRAAEYRLARLALHQGQFAEAERALRQLAVQEGGPDGANETLLQTLVHSGQTEAAVALIESYASPPDSHWLRHATELLFELNEPEPLGLMHRHWAASPSPSIFRELLNQLLIAGDTSQAETLVTDYRTRFGEDPHWRWGHVRWLAENGAHEEVVRQRISGPDGALETICQSYFALGDYANALDAAQTLCRSAPGDQYFLALLVTALRCLDDSRHSTLTAVTQLVLETDVSLSHPHLGTNDDWASLAEALARHHSMRSAPPTQSVEGGTQTPGNLLTQTAEPLLLGLREAIRSTASSFFASSQLTELPEAHPLRLFRPTQPMMHASWAILAKSGTFHRSHVHSKGWYSGTCYVEVPPAIDDTSNAGYLAIGEPPFSVKDALPPLAMIKPEVGRMILFPSYLWHCTRPFAGVGRRQVVAFDFGTPNRFV